MLQCWLTGLLAIVGPVVAFGPELTLAAEAVAEGRPWDFKKGDALMVIDVQNDFMSGQTLQTELGATYEIPPEYLTNEGNNVKPGSLAVANTFEIVRPINCLVTAFESKKLPVFYSLDWHPKDHCSYAFNGTKESNPEYFHPHGTVAGPLKEGTTNEHNYPGIKNLCKDQRTQADWHNPNAGAMQWPVHCVQSTFGSRFSPFLKVTNDATVIKKGFNGQQDAYSAFGGAQSVQGHPFDTQDTVETLQVRPNLETLLRLKKVKRLFLVGIATDYCVKSTAVDGKQLNFLKEVNVVVPLTRWVADPTKQAAIQEMQQNKVGILDWDPSHQNLERFC